MASEIGGKEEEGRLEATVRALHSDGSGCLQVLAATKIVSVDGGDDVSCGELLCPTVLVSKNIVDQTCAVGSYFGVIDELFDQLLH
ncbi:hypothetical protein QR680_019383 [Steinernema hermaphroditum]|uniref:Uncharacterized protein n=1 Tax=Steinernema hermaphroditum TaxID=289476 RepID=A0AA39LA66_9BILA|nr:hypothetical protein QR680_019383 [Steinernema hermaphroditum]